MQFPPFFRFRISCFLVTALLAASTVGLQAATALWENPRVVDQPKVAAVAPATASPQSSTSSGRGKIRQGRVTLAKPDRFRTIQRGEQVTLPLFDGAVGTGTVNFSETDRSGWKRVAGKLKVSGKTGSFSISEKDGTVSGTVLLEDAGVAYVVSGDSAAANLEEQPIGEVICAKLPTIAAVAPVAEVGPAPLPALSQPDSRPGAPAVFYLDFDGEVVTDPNWNGGQTINAAPAGMSAAEIDSCWRRVAEDFLPFNVNVTTDRAKYDAAPPGRRMRCIVTATNDFYPDAGGVALINSFSGSGKDFSDTVPCWVFTKGVGTSGKTVSDAASHELGHTLGLGHDGRTTPEEDYYTGHGSGPLSWAPIMGVGYSRTVVQWSKGEYPNANNKEDDLAIIASDKNGFGYALPQAPLTPDLALPPVIEDGNIAQSGLIGRTNEAHYYRLDILRYGTLLISANPAQVGPNLKLQLSLLDDRGVELVTQTGFDSLSTLFQAVVRKGSYILKVTGTGYSGSRGTDVGFSNYNSMGTYTLSGDISSLLKVESQPDIYVGRSSRVGLNRFGRSTQRYVVNYRGTKKIRIPVTVSNAGSRSEVFYISTLGRLGHPYRILRNKHNLAGVMDDGKYYSTTVTPSKPLELILEVRPSRDVKGTRRIKFAAFSPTNINKQDRLRIILKPRGKGN